LWITSATWAAHVEGSKTGRDRVVTRVPVYRIDLAVDRDRVVLSPAVYEVVACDADRVTASGAVDHVSSGSADEEVRAVTAVH